MKQLILFALTVSLALAQFSYGDGMPIPEIWQKPADGYAWPVVPKDVPVFETKNRKISDLDKSLRKIATANIQGSSEKVPENAILAEVDLNGDGKKEVFLYIHRMGGTAGYTYLIYTPEKTTYRMIGWLQGVAVKFVAKKNEWYQIEVSSRGGPSDYARILYTYGEDDYVMTRLENHDLAAKKVVVREIKK